jgi:hypothetical protein
VSSTGATVVALIAHPMTESNMELWMSLSPRLGNETSSFLFTTELFTWWRIQLVVIEDLLYVGFDFRGSAYLLIPKEAHWDG